MTSLSGFCNPSNPRDSHERCRLPGCVCACHWSAPAAEPVAGLTAAVAGLEDALPDLVAQCTDPQALDMAELFYEVQAARIKLQDLERDLEGQLAKALMADEVHSGTLRVERRRSRDRKQWDHDSWRRDVRAKVLRKLGLAGAQGIVTRDGEVLDAPGLLQELLAAVQNVHGAGAPKVTALRDLGLDAMDYCETTPGTVHVAVQRVAEGAPAADQGGEQDAA